MTTRKRILWLKTELLHPVDKGGRIRTYQMLRAIARAHDVTYLTLDDGHAAPTAVQDAREYCQRLERIAFNPPSKQSIGFPMALLGNLASSLPYAIQRYRSPAMREAIARLAPEHDIVICDFLAPAINLPERLPVPVVLFQHNVEAMIWERHASVATNGLRRRFMRSQYERMLRFERAVCNSVDGVVAVSEEDASEMRRRYGTRRVSAVPTGVDVDYFTRRDPTPPTRANLVFTGSMDWMPNDDAITWFLDAVFPRVRARVPEASLTVVGRDPSPSLRREAESSSYVEVTGRVPDVRPYMERASVFIVPMRVGGGTRLKIYEAMSMGLPVVSTTIGAEGLPVADGTHVWLRDDADSFADVLVRAIENPHEAQRVATGGEALVRSRFGWDGVAKEFIDQCDVLLKQRPASHSSDH